MANKGSKGSWRPVPSDGGGYPRPAGIGPPMIPGRGGAPVMPPPPMPPRGGMPPAPPSQPMAVRPGMPGPMPAVQPGMPAPNGPMRQPGVQSMDPRLWQAIYGPK